MTSFQVSFWRLGWHLTSCMEPFCVSFSFFCTLFNFLNPHRLQSFGWALRRRFVVKLQECFVDYKTTDDFPSEHEPVDDGFSMNFHIFWWAAPCNIFICSIILCAVRRKYKQRGACSSKTLLYSLKSGRKKNPQGALTVKVNNIFIHPCIIYAGTSCAGLRG